MEADINVAWRDDVFQLLIAAHDTTVGTRVYYLSARKREARLYKSCSFQR